MLSTALLLLAVTPLSAAVAIRLSVEDLLESSEWIIEGRVQRSYAGWDPKHTMIWTHYEILVSDTLRGPVQSVITISEPGGALDGLHQVASGFVPYAVGERVVLFLYRTPIGFLRSTGAGQGKFTVGPDGVARANMFGMTFMGPGAGTPIEAINSVPLNDFKQRMRRLAAQFPSKGGR